MTILVLNCGSSSIKYQVLEILSSTESTLLAKGQVERVGFEDALFVHRPTGKDRYELVTNIPNHTKGISLIIEALINEHHGVIKNLSELNAVGHRVAHGGEYFSDSVVINKDVIGKIENCVELAPLHNPAHLRGIEAIDSILPNIPQVATFDTSFHQTIPTKNYLYAIPYRYYDKLRVRKYGFHGTSHRFVAYKGCEMTGLDVENSKIITCHIGNGASVTAVLNGKSFDTSMGFTPVDGLVMGTRSGSIDPGALIYIAKVEDMSLNKLGDMINKDSGVYGISGLSSDMRDIEHAAKSGNERAAVAWDMYAERIKQFIGAYAATMGGVDMIVFTGGVGENQFNMRRDVLCGLEFMGVKIDQSVNDGLRGVDAVISTPDSKVKVVVAMTDEEFVIASDTFRLLKKRSQQ